MTHSLTMVVALERSPTADNPLNVDVPPHAYRVAPAGCRCMQALSPVEALWEGLLERFLVLVRGVARVVQVPLPFDALVVLDFDPASGRPIQFSCNAESLK
jgi:hypothetical protein